MLSRGIAEEIERRLVFRVTVDAAIEKYFVFVRGERVRLNAPFEKVAEALGVAKSNALGGMVRAAIVARGGEVVRVRGRDYYRGLRPR